MRSITSLLLLAALSLEASAQVQGGFVAGSFDITFPKGGSPAKWTPWWKRPRPTGWPTPSKRPTPTVETLPWPPLPTSSVVIPPVVTSAAPTVGASPVASPVVTTGGHDHGSSPTGSVKPRPTWPAGDGPVPPGFAFEPRLTEETLLTPGSKLVTKRTGPYKVKPGEMFSTFDPTVELPCTNCWVVAGEGRIEYEDGTEANINTGAYLHHMVVASLGGTGGGPPVGVLAGGNSTGGPPAGIATGGSSSGGGGFGGPPGLSCDPDAIQDVKAGLGFGNERSVTRFNGDGSLKFGAPIKPGDRFSLILDLMNDAKEEKILYARTTYEIVEGDAAKGFVQAKSFKLDVGECTTSEVPAQASGKYSLKSKPFTSKIAGQLLYMTGHMHDGGVNTTIFVNDKEVCASEMLYDRRELWREPEYTGLIQPHISDAGVCKTFGRIEPGDKVHIEVHYDADKFPPTQHSGDGHGLHPVMGVAFVFVGPDPKYDVPITKPITVPPVTKPTAAPTGDGHDHDHGAPAPTSALTNTAPAPIVSTPPSKSEVFPVWTTLDPANPVSTASPMPVLSSSITRPITVPAPSSSIVIPPGPKPTVTSPVIGDGHDHDHGTPTTAAAPTKSVSVPAPAVTTPAGDGHDHDHGSGGGTAAPLPVPTTGVGEAGEVRWADWP